MKASEQLRGWAVDRAIEFLKAKPESTVDCVLEAATKLADYCFDDESSLAELDKEPDLDANREESVQ